MWGIGVGGLVLRFDGEWLEVEWSLVADEFEFDGR